MKWIHDRMAGKVYKHSLSPWPNVTGTLGAMRLDDCYRSEREVITFVRTATELLRTEIA